MSSRKRFLRGAGILACLVIFHSSFANQATAHPGHGTSAEAEYNAKSQSLEVALEVDLGDLEIALQAAAGKRIVLEKTKGLDRLIEEYLKKSFSARRGEKTLSELKWIGKEIEAGTAWLYFELPLSNGALSHGIEGVELSHRVFFKTLPGQINVLRIRSGKRQTTLSFSEKSPRQIVSFKKHDLVERDGKK